VVGGVDDTVVVEIAGKPRSQAPSGANEPSSSLVKIVSVAAEPY
jgi:hypothetical protein